MKYNYLDKTFIFLISISSILTTVKMEFKILGLETSIEFLLLTIWIFKDLIKFISSKALVNNHRYNLLIVLFAFVLLFFIEIFVKNNFKAFYEINFLIMLYAFYQFQKIDDFKFLKKISIIITLVLIVSLFYQDASFSLQNWDHRWVGDEYVKRKSMFGYVSTTLSIMLVGAVIYLVELYKLKEINFFLLCVLLGILLYFQILTYSRAGFIFLFFYLAYSVIQKKKMIIFKFTIIFILFFILSIIFSLYNQDFYTQYLNIFINLSENARFSLWTKYLGHFFDNSSPLELLFGIKFFTLIVDNTIISILIGKGFIGFLIYILIFYIFINDISFKKNSYQTQITKLFIFILLYGFLIMDFFGQRKIIFLLALYYSTLMACYGKKYNNT